MNGTSRPRYRSPAMRLLIERRPIMEKAFAERHPEITVSPPAPRPAGPFRDRLETAGHEEREARRSFWATVAMERRPEAWDRKPRPPMTDEEFRREYVAEFRDAPEAFAEMSPAFNFIVGEPDAVVISTPDRREPFLGGEIVMAPAPRPNYRTADPLENLIAEAREVATSSPDGLEPDQSMLDAVAEVCNRAEAMLAALKAMVLNDAHTYRDCHKRAVALIAQAEGRADG